jgi:hypothetical protein
MMLAVVLGNAPHHPLPSGSPAIQARHGHINARFLPELQAPEAERRNPLAVVLERLLDARGVPLAAWHDFFAREPQARDGPRHGGHTHAEAALGVQSRTQLCQRGIDLFLHKLAHTRECRLIAERLAAAGVWAGPDVSRRATKPE